MPPITDPPWTDPPPSTLPTTTTTHRHVPTFVHLPSQLHLSSQFEPVTLNGSSIRHTHEPLVTALLGVLILWQAALVCIILGCCYFGQFTLSFTACCFSGTWIRVGKPKGGPPDVAEAVAEQLKKESIKASLKKSNKK